MKKVLIASTALVAAGLMTAGTAQASEKIKLNLGGFSKWWVVGQWNDSDIQKGGTRDYNSVDVKGDNEIYFGGSTTLDNGMKVGIQIEMEAGGHTETSQGGDVIDESYIFVETGFGKFIVGSENNGTYLLHVMAPDAAGNWGEGGIMTGGFAVAKPTNVSIVTPLGSGNNTTAIVTDGDAEGITYVAPTFYGLTVGGSYKPSVTEDDRGLTDLDSNAGEVFGAAALYANTFGGVGFKLSAGWATYDLTTTSDATGTVSVGDSTVNEYAFGTQLAYAGFTLGGSYRQVEGIRQTTSATTLEDTADAKAWDVGLQYATGPYAVSLAYFRSEANGDVTYAGEDKITFYQASGKYALGPGVDVLASIGYAEYEDERPKTGTNDADYNDGWTVMTGMSLSF